MPEVDYEWVKDQFKKARIRKITGDSVLALLKAWEDLDFPDDRLAKEAADTFAELALGNPIVAEDDVAEKWVPQESGIMIRRGDEVRVKQDAYEGDLGRLHNGRRGKAVDVRGGDVLFTTTDGKKPELNGVHHPPRVFEVRVK